MSSRIRTACNRDCPDACGIVATVDKGRIVRLQGDPEHPVTQGFLCKRTSRFLKRQYDPERITTALVRRRKGRSDASWQAVSNDQALDLVADKLLQIRKQYGPAAIMNYRCGGSMGMMKYVTDYFFQRFGPVTIKSGDICAGAGSWAQETDFGKSDSNDLFDLLNARTILLWGKNVYVSQVHLLPILKRAQAAGAKLILIDPIKHRSAGLCDEFCQVEPGGDAALALGMARWLHDNGLLDHQAETYCDHFHEYLELIGRNSLQEWASLAGVGIRWLERIAQRYSDGPSTILVGWGMQRRRNGAAIIRAIDALGAVSGNIGKPGAGVSFNYARKSAFDLAFVDDATAPRRIPEPLLGPGIEAASDPPIKLVFVTAANPVTNIPDSTTVQRALSQRFTVVTDMFMTDTARCADVVLPAASMLEDSDLIGAYGHHYLNRLKPVVPPPDQALTDYEIIRQLALRVGLEDAFARDADDWLRDMIQKYRTEGITLRALEAGTIRNPVADTIAYRERKFETANGRCKLITDYHHPAAKETNEYPLQLMAISTDEAQASQWSSKQQSGPCQVRVHPLSAGDCLSGELVELRNQYGRLTCQLRLDPDVHENVVVMDKGGWLSAGRCANAMIQAECSDHGQCAVYYDTPVQLVRCRPPLQSTHAAESR